MLEGRLQTVKSDQKIEEAANNIVALKKKENTQNTEAVRLTDIQKKHHQGIVAAAKKEMDLINDKKNKFQDFLKIQERQKELLEATLNGNREEVELRHAINDAVAIHGESKRQEITDILTANAGLKEQGKIIKENADTTEQLKEKFKQIGVETRQGLVQNLREAINGSQTLGQALNNVLNNLKNKLLDIALNEAIKGIGRSLGLGGGGGFLAGLFGRERGGPVSAGGAYVVGERGPEILQMGSKGGNIIPNSQIGGSGSVTNIVNVSVDASGSAVQGDDANAQQLGQTIANVVKEVIIDEQRSGGLLA